MRHFADQRSGHVVVRMDPGDSVLESFEQVIAEAGITDGAVVSAFGTLSRCHLHIVTTMDFPAVEEFIVYEEPLELLSITGVIADSSPHLHFTVSDGRRAFGGHLERDNVVLYTAEAVIATWGAPGLVRKPDQWGIPRLEPKT